MGIQMTAYPPGQEPNFWDPYPSVREHRFALGRATPAALARPPLIAICMNPSYADENTSDKTVNRIIRASVDLSCAGWIMLNLYPERVTRPIDLSTFDSALSAANCAVIERVVSEYGAKEVLGAWGDHPNSTIHRAKVDVRATLLRLGVKAFHLDDLTVDGQPRHPTPRGKPLAMAGPKRLFSW